MSSYVTNLPSYSESHDAQRSIIMLMLATAGVVLEALFSVNRLSISGGVLRVTYVFCQNLGASLALLLITLLQVKCRALISYSDALI